jgi:lactocepin
MQKRFLRSGLCVVLALVMLLSAGGGAFAADNSEDVQFRQVSSDAVSASLLQDASAEQSTAETTDTKQEVRVSIVLKGNSAIEAGYSVQSIGKNTAAAQYRRQLVKTQEAVTQTIEKKTGTDLDVQWNLTLTANLISADVKYGDIDKIKAAAGVKDVVLEAKYEPAADSASDGTASPQMTISTGMTHMTQVWNSGYTGAGSRIAVIDTGLDTDHQSFSPDAFQYALEQDAKAAGRTVASYGLLSANEIASKLTQLNAYTKKATTASALYVNEKTAFGFNYIDADTDITHDNDSQGDHGSHVSGIAAANRFLKQADGSMASAAEACSVVGNAPDAQLMVMKVFGKNGGAYDSDYMAAIEDAIVLGADSINLSLGTNTSGFATAGVYQSIMKKLEAAGSVVTVAAGNDGNWAEQATDKSYLGSGYLYTEDAATDTIGSPGSYTNSLAVASVDNNGQISNGSIQEANSDGTKYAAAYSETLYNNMKALSTLDTSSAGSGTEYDFVMIDGYCKAGDLDFLDVKGKILICQRGGGITFADKAAYAVSKGAAATIVYNNTSGTIGMDLTAYTSSEPAVSVTQSVGAALRQRAAQQTDAGNNVYYTGKLTVAAGRTTIAGTDSYDTMSSFSSWGTTGDLALKPEITAPGGTIYSVDGSTSATDRYKTNSGTSMAAPQVAGIAAVVQQYIRESGFGKGSGYSARQLAQSLLMSTAEPLKDKNGNYYSVLQQGAGLVNGEGAISADSYIIMDADATPSYADGKVKAELGDDPEKTGSYTFSFRLFNTTAHDKVYQLSADVFSQDCFEAASADKAATTAAYMKTSTRTLASSASFSQGGVLSADGTITAPAKGSVTVTVQLSLAAAAKTWLNANFPNGTYLEAYVFAKPEADSEGAVSSTHSIPVLAFYGNWTDPSMFDGASYKDGKVISSYCTENTTDSSRKPYIEIYQSNNEASYGTNHVLLTAKDSSVNYALGGNPLIKDKAYWPERNAVRAGASVKAWEYHQIRDSAERGYQVKDLTSGAVCTKVTEENQMLGGYYDKHSACWQCLPYTWNVGFTLPEIAEGDTLEFSMWVLPEYYSKGALGAASVPGSGACLKTTAVMDNTAPTARQITYENGSLNVTASDNNYIAAAVLYSADGKKVLSSTGSKEEIAKGAEAVYTLSAAGNTGNSWLIQVFDYAMNVSTYSVEVKSSRIVYSGVLIAYDLEDGKWIRLDKNSGKNSALTSGVRACQAAAMAGGTVYTIAYNTELYSLSVSDLTAATLIGDVGANIVDLAYNAADGCLYGVSDQSKLLRIDRKTGRGTVLGSTPVQTNTLACSADGTFYSSQYGGGKVYSYTLESAEQADLRYDINGDGVLNEADCQALLDVVTGTRTDCSGIDVDADGDVDTHDAAALFRKLPASSRLVAELPLRSQYLQAMEVDPSSGSLYWTSYCTEQIGSTKIGFSVLYEIDPDTGSYVRCCDAGNQLSGLLIPDKDISSGFAPIGGTAALSAAAQTGTAAKTAVTELSGVASEYGVENARASGTLSAGTTGADGESSVSVALTSDAVTTNGLYRVLYDAGTMKLVSAESTCAMSSVQKSAGRVVIGYTGSGKVAAQTQLAVLTFRTSSCTSSVTIEKLQENNTHPETSSVQDAGSHDWSEWSVTKQATCSETGEKTRTCSKCQTVQTQQIPLDPSRHSWGDWTVLKSAADNEPGTEIRTCAWCGTTKKQWVVPESLQKADAAQLEGKIDIQQDCIATAQILGAGVNAVTKLTGSDGNLRYLVELSGSTAANAEFLCHLEQISVTGSGYGRAIKREKADSVGWDANDLDYSVTLKDGIGSMKAYSYDGGSLRAELTIYFFVGSTGSGSGRVTYITTPAQPTGSFSAYVSQIGIWDADVAKSYWTETTDDANKKACYTGYIWLEPETTPQDGTAAMTLVAAGTPAVYRSSGGTLDKSADLLQTGLTAALKNGSAAVEFTSIGNSDLGDYERCYKLFLRNHLNQAPVLAGGGTGTARVRLGETYHLDLGTVFTDPDADTLTYTVIQDGKSRSSAQDFSYTPSEAGTVTLCFTASDTTLSSPAYTLTLNVVSADGTPGDVNGDGVIDNRDVAVLRRYIAGWSGVSVTLAAADVNDDGVIDNRDVAILRRYIAGWSGIKLG